MRRMNEERLPQKIVKLCPTERRQKRRPRNSWMHKAKNKMREKGINNIKWINRKNGKEK